MSWIIWIYLGGMLITLGLIAWSLRGYDYSYQPGDTEALGIFMMVIWPLIVVGYAIWGFFRLTDRTVASLASRSARRRAEAQASRGGV